MAEPFLGEIRIGSFNFAPKGWALCDGQLLPIRDNQALFALLGPTFGGNGTTTFALPDLRGRTPIHVGSGHRWGEAGGSSAATLSIGQIPEHTHSLAASSAATGGSDNPSGRFLGGGNNVYHAPGSLTSLTPGSVMNSGGSQAHTNMQPCFVLNFFIALQGIFPSQN